MAKVIVLLLAFCASSMASNVLMVLPLGSRSHKNIFIPLANSLAAEGHDVNLVSMYNHLGSTPPLYNDVAATKAQSFMEQVGAEFNIFDLMKKAHGGNVNSIMMKTVITHLPKFCDAFLRDPAVEQIWNSKPDIILLPALMNECGLVFVEKFKVPFVYVTTSGLTPWTADLTGTPEHPAFVPNQYLPYSDDMTLWERTVNTIARLTSPALRERFVLKRLEPVAQKFLNDNTVSLAEVERNVSMVFVNSHISLGFPRPLQPNVIEIGGMHCQKAKSLANVDPELNDFLGSSVNGSILFSLGSHIKSSDMPDKFRNILLNSFERLPYNIVWKWENDNMTDLPSNVMVRKWLPQQDVLGHPSLRAFFTHGGLLSTQEAVYHGVPIVGLPLMSDQNLNVKQAETLGFGKGLNLFTLTEDQVVEALTEVIEDPSYRTVAEERSMIFRDQETTPLHRATYWTNYVLRHKGAKHLQSKSLHLSLSQYLLLDVMGVLVSLLLASLFALYLLIKFAWKLATIFASSLGKKLLRHMKEHMH